MDVKEGNLIFTNTQADPGQIAKPTGSISKLHEFVWSWQAFDNQ